MIAICLYIISILFFILSLPVKGGMLALKVANTCKSAVNSLKDDASDFEKLKNRLSKRKESAKGVVKLGVKVAIRGLKALLLLIRGISVILGLMGSLMFMIYALVFALIIATVGYFVISLNSDGFTSKLSVSTTTSQNKIKKKEVTDKQTIDKWLKACEEVWLYCRKKGWEYTWATNPGGTRDTKEYGNIGLDCSGYVSASLVAAGYIKKGKRYITSSMSELSKDTSEWKYIALTSSDQIKRGDIVCVSGSHVAVYAGNKMWWNNSTEGSSFQDRTGTTNTSMDWWVKRTGTKFILRLQTVTNAGGGGSVAGLYYPKEGGNLEIPWFCQGDYGTTYLTSSQSYPISKSGCLFTSIAMVVTYYKGKKYTPIDVATHLRQDNGIVKYYNPGQGGEGPSACPNIGKDFDIDVKTSKNLKGDYDAMLKYAKKGYPIICSMSSSSQFTDNAHYIVVRGANDKGTCWVNDPNGRSNASRKGWSKDLTGADKWLHVKWNLRTDVYNCLNRGAWAIIPK